MKKRITKIEKPSPEDVINRWIEEENVKFNQERDDWIIEAMEEYAILYYNWKKSQFLIFL